MKYVNMNQVISRIYRNLNLTEDIRFEDAKIWAYEVLRLVNVTPQYQINVVELEIVDYKAELPCDLNQIIMVTKDGFGMKYRPAEPFYNTFVIENNYIPCNYENNYDIRYPYIHTNFTDTHIILSYTSFVLDDDGYPMIPDNELLHQAMFWYIYKMLLLGGYESKTQQITFDYCDRKAIGYMTAAKGDMLMPSLAQMENIKDMRMKQITPLDEYKRAFRTLTNKEYLRINII